MTGRPNSAKMLRWLRASSNFKTPAHLASSFPRIGFSIKWLMRTIKQRLMPTIRLASGL